MNFTIWGIKKQDEKLKKEIEKVGGFFEIALKTLAARAKDCCFGLSFEERFFHKKIESYKTLKDIEKAAKRIRDAVEKKEKIAVFADYDCDGICSAAILKKFFEEKGLKILPIIPERDDGYGLNTKVIEKIKKEKVNLTITVDNGIAAFEEAEKIKSLGIDLIITDHHNSQETLPDAFAVVDPKRKDDETFFKEISGAFVAFKLICAVEKRDCNDMLEQYCDLLLISTIGDVMPLVFENRVVVEKGLEKIKRTKNLGLKCLLELLFENCEKISSTDIAFLICPKLNAAGRLKKAFLSFNLLVETKEEEARRLSKIIVQYNEKRKEFEEEMFKQALEEIEDIEENVIVIAKEGWEVGLLGLLAARLLKKFKKPAIVFSIENEILTGSARSFEGFSIFEALKNSSELFLRWGGHKSAAGLTLKKENYEKFKQQIFEFSKKNKPELEKIYVDCLISPKEAVLKNVKNLQNIGPFGSFNEEPVFLIKRAKLEKIVPLSFGKHLKLGFVSDGVCFDVLLFNFERARFYFKPNEEFNLLVNLNVNCFKGTETVSFKMLDFRPCGILQEKIMFELCEFEKIRLEKKFEDLVERKELLYVYNIFKKIKIFNGGVYYLHLLTYKKISFFKLLIVVDVFLKFKILKKIGDIICLEEKEQLKLNEEKLIKMLK